MTERQFAVATLFQDIWAQNQLSLPDDSPDRATRIVLHRHSDPTWIGWTDSSLVRSRAVVFTSHDAERNLLPTACTVDLARLSQRQLPLAARRGNFETAAFVDGWITAYQAIAGGLDGLDSAARQQRLALTLFAFWSIVRLTPSGQKRTYSVWQLSRESVRAIEHWRRISLSAFDDAKVDLLMAAEFARTRYQESLDRRMVRAAVRCHRMSSHEVTQIAVRGGWSDQSER